MSVLMMIVGILQVMVAMLFLAVTLAGKFSSVVEVLTALMIVVTIGTGASLLIGGAL